MNAEKLRRLQSQVRIGGKGTPRRKKKVMHQSAATDDKKLQSSLKKLSVSTIPGIEEVNIIKDDLTVIHFNNPKAQASLSANTFAVTGHGETKKIVEMLPEILPQLGQDTVMQLRMFANTMSGNQAKPGNIAGTTLENVTEEDEVPMLVNDFEEVAKMEEAKSSTAKKNVEPKSQQESAKNKENVPLSQNTEQKIDAPKVESTAKNDEKIDKKAKKQQNKQSANGAAKNKPESAKNETKQQKLQKNEKPNKQETIGGTAEKKANDGPVEKQEIEIKSQDKCESKAPSAKENESMKEEAIKVVTAVQSKKSAQKDDQKTTQQKPKEDKAKANKLLQEIPKSETVKGALDDKKIDQSSSNESPKITDLMDSPPSKGQKITKPQIETAKESNNVKAQKTPDDSPSPPSDEQPKDLKVQQILTDVSPPKDLKPQQTPKVASQQESECDSFQPKSQLPPKDATEQPKDIKTQQLPREESAKPIGPNVQSGSNDTSPKPKDSKTQSKPNDSSPQAQSAPKATSPQPKNLKQQTPRVESQQSKDHQRKQIDAQQPPKAASPQPMETPKLGSPQPKETPKLGSPQPKETPKLGSPQPKETPKLGSPQPKETPKHGSPQPKETPKLGSPQPKETPKLGSPQPKETPKLGSPQPKETPKLGSPQPKETLKLGSPQPKETPKIGSPQPKETPKLASPQPKETQKLGSPQPKETPKLGSPQPKDLNTQTTVKGSSPQPSDLKALLAHEGVSSQAKDIKPELPIQVNETQKAPNAESEAMLIEKDKHVLVDVNSNKANVTTGDNNLNKTVEATPSKKEDQQQINVTSTTPVKIDDAAATPIDKQTIESLLENSEILNNSSNNKDESTKPDNTIISSILPVDEIKDHVQKVSDNKRETLLETVTKKENIIPPTSQPQIPSPVIEEATVQIDEVIAAAIKEIAEMPAAATTTQQSNATTVVPTETPTEIKSNESQQISEEPNTALSMPITKKDDTQAKLPNVTATKSPNQTSQTKTGKQSTPKPSQQAKQPPTKAVDKPSNSPKSANAQQKPSTPPSKKSSTTPSPANTPPSTPTDANKPSTPSDSTAGKNKEIKCEAQKKQTNQSTQKPAQAKPNATKTANNGPKAAPNSSSATGPGPKKAPPSTPHDNKQAKQPTPPKSPENNAAKVKQPFSPKADGKQPPQNAPQKPANNQPSSAQATQKTNP